MSALSTRMFLFYWHFLHLHSRLIIVHSNYLNQQWKSTIHLAETLIFNCISDNTYPESSKNTTLHEYFLSLFSDDLWSWVWIVAFHCVCFLMILNSDHQDFPVYIAALSVTILISNNNRFWHDFSTKFEWQHSVEATLFLHPTWTQLNSRCSNWHTLN